MLTLEEEIKEWEMRVSMLNPILYSNLIDDHMQLINWLKDYKRLLEQEPKTDYKSFAEWVASEIFSDNWEYNKDSFEEIACRKLVKLGIVTETNNKWVFAHAEKIEQEQRTDILDKVRAEIKSLSNANPSYWHTFDVVEREDVLDIIDEYRQGEG